MSTTNPISFEEARKNHYREQHRYLAEHNGFTHNYPDDCVSPAQKRAFRREEQKKSYLAFCYNFALQNGLIPMNCPYIMWEKIYGKKCWKAEQQRRSDEVAAKEAAARAKKAAEQAEFRQRMYEQAAASKKVRATPLKIVVKKPQLITPQPPTAKKQISETLTTDRIMCAYNSEAFKARYLEAHNQFVKVSSILNGELAPTEQHMEIVNGEIISLLDRASLSRAKSILSSLLDSYKKLFNRLGGVIEASAQE